ncbi:MAG: ral stress protein [Schlesneria sp.]|nr:ral stress protein [Schlesneria sp.]
MTVIRITIILALMASTTASHADDFHTLMMRATVKLQHERSTATGFILRQPRPAPAEESRWVLVTAAHVLERSSDNETIVVYRVCEAEGAYRKEPTALTIRKDGQPLWTKHPTEDIAAMVVTPPDKVDLPKISTERLANDELLRKHSIHPGQTVTCLGYPHRTEANQAGFPILRSGSIASYPLIPATLNKTFMVSANTFEGDSGGPIYVVEPALHQSGEQPEEVRLILGLMHGQHFLDEEMAMIYGNSKVRHRLGLGIVMQAAFIRETLEKLP